jgi:Ca2+-binding EF-hand superfamily protein
MRSMLTVLLLGFSASIVAQPAVDPTQAKDDWEVIRCLADKDKDDKISQEEVKKINMIPPRTLIRGFAEMDSNKDGVVTLQEYTDYIQKTRSAWETEFQNADTDKSGGLSEAELANTKPGQFAQIKRQFQAMDTDKDGQVTMEERDRFAADKAATREVRRNGANKANKANQSE